MHKIRIGFIVLSVLLILLLVGCSGNSSNSIHAPVENYANRYPGEYNTELSDYSDIQIKDNNGNDISHIAIDLWYAANEIYNVDDTKMFEMDYGDTMIDGHEPYNELHNYDAVVRSVFTENGIAQLERAEIISISETFILKYDGKTYRKAPYKSGYSFANALTDMQIKELAGDRITLAVTYASINRDNTTVTSDFTIVNVSGTWLVDYYVYPESTSETSPSASLSQSVDNLSIEIKDSKGDKYTLTYADLYYHFYNNAQKSGVLVYSWEHPSAIEPSFLSNFFSAQSNWNQVANDAVIVYLSQEIVEDYLKMYFDIQSTQVRQSMWYKPEQESYQLALYPWERPSIITNATTDGNMLTIFYETYNDFIEELPVLRQGQVTIEIERYPIRWKFISNEITYDAEE